MSIYGGYAADSNVARVWTAVEETRQWAVRHSSTLVTALAAVSVGYLTAQGRGPLILLALVALAAAVAVVARPELVLLVWFAALLTHGRRLTLFTFGPLHVTEVLLAVLALGLTARLLVNPGALRHAPPRALRFAALLVAALWIPGILGLASRTESLDFAAARNFALILYTLFALVAVVATDPRRSGRLWFVGTLLGCALAFVVVFTGNAGEPQPTSTGAVRLASHTFAIAFGVGPILLAAAARERLIRPLWALIGSVPLFVGLVSVNHRSAWLGFAAGLLVVFARRISPTLLVSIVGLVAVLAVLLSAPADSYRGVPFGDEIVRAKSITKETDPNRKYRLIFWERAMGASVNSPLIGNGFDRYPETMLPYRTSVDEWPSPHNSFVGIAYRVGIAPLVVMVLMLLWLVARGFVEGHRRSDRRERVTLLALSAIVVHIGITSAFNVFLESPYAAPLFWGAVGMLAVAVFRLPVARAVNEPVRAT